MAEKYRIEFSSIKYNIPYRLSIYDDDYAGTPIQLNSANPPVVMRKDSDGIFSGTSLDIGIEVPVSMPWGITDLYSKSIRDHKVELYKSEVLIWAGYMVPEEYSDPLIAPPFDITLRAVDGIGTLKDFDFSLPANGTIQHTVVNYGLGDMITSTCTESEPVSQLKIIQHCLAKLSLSLPLAVLMNISESRHNSLYSALSQTYMNPSAFYDEDGDPLTCDKVISLILASYDPEITLTQHAGHWMITRAIDTPDNSYIIYDATGVCTATGVSIVESIAVDSVDNYTPSHCFPIGQLTRAFYPQMKKYTINKELQLKANFNPFTTSDDAFFYDEAKAKYISKLYCSIAQSGMTVTKFIMSDGTMAHFVSGKVYDISGYNVDSTYTYNYNSNGRDVKITIPIAIIHATITGSLAVTINGSTFDVPISKAASDCSLTELTLYKSTTEGAQSLSISFNIPTSAYSVLLGDVSISFVPFVSEDAFISSIEADVLINSDALKSETIDSFGDCPAETVSSHIWNSGFFLSDKTPTGTWKMKADTEYTSLMSNVARSIASNNRVARQQYSGVLMGEKLTPNSIIKHEANDNKIFRIVTASHNLREDELEVEILELLPFAEASTTISTTSIYSDAKKTNTTVNGANDYTVYGGNVGIGRRIYQLPTATDTTDMWVMADKEGTEEAQKVPLPKSVSAFSQLTDVALTDLAVGQFAYFNGEKWINTTLFVYDSVTNTFRFKANVVAEGEVTAWAAGSSNASIWDSLPTASATTKGGIKIGTGLTIVDGVVSVDASAIGGNQTLTLNGSTLSISGSAGNSVDLSTIIPTNVAPLAHRHAYSDLDSVPATFAPSAHNHSFASLTSKPTTVNGYGITDVINVVHPILDMNAVPGISAFMGAYQSTNSNGLYLAGWQIVIDGNTAYRKQLAFDINSNLHIRGEKEGVFGDWKQISTTDHTHNTTVITEGANLYFTNDRARSACAISGTVYDSARLGGVINTNFTQRSINEIINATWTFASEDEIIKLSYHTGHAGFIRGYKNNVYKWYVGAGDGATDDIYLATYANANLKLVTSGVTQLRITGTGDVAIGYGETAPSYKLDVNGDIRGNWHRAYNNGGLYIADSAVYYTNNGLAPEISSGNNELGLSCGYSIMYINYAQGRIRTVPTTLVWCAGNGLNSYAAMEFGDTLVHGKALSSNLGITTEDGIGQGVSLYNSFNTLITENGYSFPAYGLFFGKTAYFGTHGGVTGAWATYFTMWDAAAYGWVFKKGTTNVASIDTNGNIVSTGEVTAYSSSDATLKTAVQDIQGRALSTLKRLRPVEFEWNDIAKKLNPEFARHTHSASFIAQEYETVFEWATHTIWGKYKSIDKNILFPYLVAGVNELDYKIDTVEDRLNRRIEELENEVKQLKSMTL